MDRLGRAGALVALASTLAVGPHSETSSQPDS
jgi:hypothetical protein